MASGSRAVRQHLDLARRAAKHRHQKRAVRLLARAAYGKASYIVSSFGSNYCAPPDGDIVVF
jgi:hypothetical protein